MPRVDPINLVVLIILILLVIGVLTNNALATMFNGTR
jgi:hypothetical protein